MGISDILIFVAYVGLLAGGFLTPFVGTLGYVWVDSFYPQHLSSILSGMPVAAVMGSAALLMYVLMDRKAAPRLGMFMIMIGASTVTSWPRPSGPSTRASSGPVMSAGSGSTKLAPTEIRELRIRPDRRGPGSAGGSVAAGLTPSR